MNTINHTLIIEHPITALTIAFLATALLFLCTIMLSRIIKTHAHKSRAALLDQLQRKINIIVLHDKQEDFGCLFPWNYHLLQLRKLIRKSTNKQLMIDLIITNKQNLSGRSSILLKKIYIRLGLKRFSVAKLSRFGALTKIKAIQELTEMECVDVVPRLQSLFYHKNKMVRHEAFMAMIRLAGSASFSLISGFSGSISGWTRIVIHKHLNSMPVQQLPRFYEWIDSSNREVRIFALQMIQQFQQLDAIPALATLLNDNDLEIATLAVDTLSTLGADQYADEIARLGRCLKRSESLAFSISRALGKIGSTMQKDLLAFYMIQGSYRVRLEAIRALLKLKISAKELCHDFNLNNDKELESLFSHATDPLLV